MNDKPLYKGSTPTSTTFYVPVPVRNGTIGASIHWPDTTSSATITLELTSHPGGSSGVSGGASVWKDSGVSLTGPAASAAGSELVNVENARQKYARIKVVTAAATTLEIYDGTCV